MTYKNRIINDRPSHFYPLDEGNLSFVDQMTAEEPIINGNPVPAPTLVVGGGTSYAFTGNDNFRFASRVFYEDSVQNPFTLESWFKPVAVDGPKGIIGHGSQSDGLWFDGDAIHFTTLHGEAGDCTASYYPSTTTGSFHVVGVHTGSKNELYVNGVRVASIDLSQEQIDFGYEISVSPGYLYVGHLSGSIIIDSLAVYSTALNSRTVKLHFLWGRDAPDLRSVVTNHGGNYWSFTDESASVVFDFKFDTDEEWRSGETTSVSRENNILSPAFDETGVTRAGVWQAGFILGAVADSVDGSKIEWDSDGSVSVQTSLNGGISWQNATNGREVQGIGPGFSTAGVSMEVRVNFSAGEPLDTISRMRSLSIKLYSSRVSSSNISGLPATFNGNFALCDREYQPIEQEDRSGVDLYNATASIKSENARTIEMWMRIENVAEVDEYIFDARPGSNAYLRFSGSEWSTSASTILYVNGDRKSGSAINIPTQRWTHIVAVLPTVTNENIAIGNRNLSMKVGMYANYPQSMNDEQVKKLYNAYLGIPSNTVVEDMNFRIIDPGSSGVKIYSYPWTLTASG